MALESPYLEAKLEKEEGCCNMQVVFVDIVSYSKRISLAQVKTINSFMNVTEEALTNTGKKYFEYTQKNDVQVRRDIVIRPSGDGAAIAFPFVNVPDMHLFFACELLRIIGTYNDNSDCDAFREQGW
ncbi:MAG: hypothetical protein AB2793_17155, partial [Candidatus Thiodiazotropha sp.]